MIYFIFLKKKSTHTFCRLKGARCHAVAEEAQAVPDGRHPPPSAGARGTRGAAGDPPPRNASPSLASPRRELFGGGRRVPPHSPCVGLCPPLVPGSWKDRAEPAAPRSAAPAQIGATVRLGRAQPAKAGRAERYGHSAV